MIIAIDPGHGGSDPGAICPAGTWEKDHNLAVSLYVRNLLQQAGHKVVMTRETDKNVAEPGSTMGEELQARVNIANLADADIFLSIHVSALGDSGDDSAETWYYINGMDLAQYIQEEVIKLGLTDRGVKRANYYVLKYTYMPAILCELSFISNLTGEIKLVARKLSKQAAIAIANGIIQWSNAKLIKD